MNLVRHLKPFSWALASRILPLLYGLSLILIIIPHLSSISEFGRYSLVFQIFTLIALLNKSLILNPMVRFASDPDDYDRMVRSGLHLSLLFYIICSIVVWLVSPIAAAMLRIEVGDLRFVNLLMIAFFFRDFGFFIQQIRYRTARLFIIEATYFIGSAGGFICLILSRNNLTAREVLCVNAVMAAASSLLALRFGFGGTRVFGRFNAPAVSKIVKYGLYTLPIGLANSFMNSADTLVLGIIFNPAVVGVYNGAKQVYRIFSAITQAVGILVLPYASRLSASNRKGEIKALFEKTIPYTWIGLAGVAVIGWLSAGRLYAFLGNDYSESAALLAIMLFAAPFEGIFYVASNILYGIGKAGKVALVSTGSLVLLVALLIPGAYLLGVKGAAGALSLSLIITGVWMFMLSGKVLETGLKPSLRRLMSNLRTMSKSGWRS